MTIQLRIKPWLRWLDRLPAWNPMAAIAATTLPLLGLTVFIILWHFGAAQVNTSLGQFPGPATVFDQTVALWQEHDAARDKEAAFYDRLAEQNAARQADNPDFEPLKIAYPGKPTFLDQIGTSLVTVLAGFTLGSLLAIPAGILVGLSHRVHQAVNPIIQLFKPVSPLAWLPLVTMVVSAVYVTDEPLFDKSFITSMFTVTLCCLWPTLINTAVGVANIDQDLRNVSQVLRLPTLTHIRRIVIPSAIPMIFTGLRVSLGIAWMVLIAAEMLAQNPGLGKFVWDEFQNGSSNSLGRIMVAVLVIGLIGYGLDRIMLQLQSWVDWDKTSQQR